MALSDADKIGRIRRFYQAAAVEEREGGGFYIALDGRAAKTPAGAPLVLPTRALAELIAAEWRAQATNIEFSEMPATRLAFTALDRSGAVREGMAGALARQAQSDAPLYRSETAAHAAREAEAWGPWRAWAEQELGLTFTLASGIVHQPQPAATLAQIRRLADGMDEVRLTAVVYAAGLYESAILALAVERGVLDALHAYRLSRLEEQVQVEQWGADAEAEARRQRLEAEAAMLGAWFGALG